MQERLSADSMSNVIDSFVNGLSSGKGMHSILLIPKIIGIIVRLQGIKGINEGLKKSVCVESSHARQ